MRLCNRRTLSPICSQSDWPQRRLQSPSTFSQQPIANFCCTNAVAVVPVPRPWLAAAKRACRRGFKNRLIGNPSAHLAAVHIEDVAAAVLSIEVLPSLKLWRVGITSGKKKSGRQMPAASFLPSGFYSLFSSGLRAKLPCVEGWVGVRARRRIGLGVSAACAV